MGHIVHLKFKCEDEKKLKLLVCALPFFSEYDPQTREFYYRGHFNKNHGFDMPDAFIKIEKFGLEFCAYGNTETINELYEQLKRRLVIEFGQYTECY